jgi:N-acylglucosamine-6-phosphate 2-epimerase
MALADCGTLADARYSIESGVDAIGTTMSGYTPDSPKQEGPDFDLLTNLVALESTPVFAEGRIWTREDARRAIEIGAHFVVVGTAITNPTAITSRFETAMRG